ncbi:UNVERIFIED_CONTAM: hypothetical protein GTU68_049612, partial [Idotea baltica]|nr:hypothetical protein [Idotea baltica]
RCKGKFVGEYCQYLNPCQTGFGPRCQNGGTCKVVMSVSSPNFQCECTVGYSASLCEIAVENACDSDPCQNGATCQLITLDEYRCQCPTGYRGTQCQMVDHCASQPCRNGASCQSVEDGFTCTCPRGFTGPTCTTDVNECKKAPCKYGECKNTFGSYT